MSRIQDILDRLHRALQPTVCELSDDSALHIGHAGATGGAGHYRLRIVCTRFEGLNRISRHRLVYDAVGDLMQNEIHALAITALAPSELPGDD